MLYAVLFHFLFYERWGSHTLWQVLAARQLRDANLIEFKGEATQTGGYYITQKLKKKLKENK